MWTRIQWLVATIVVAIGMQGVVVAERGAERVAPDRQKTE
jgi:hypothetical protein